jgi:hypothetical protein
MFFAIKRLKVLIQSIFFIVIDQIDVFGTSVPIYVRDLSEVGETVAQRSTYFGNISASGILQKL